MSKFAWIVFCLIVANLPSPICAQHVEFKYQAAPVDNPLKGLVPYSQQMPWCDPDFTDEEKTAYDKTFRETVFPHSVEFNYFSMKQLMPAEDKIEWEPIETALDQAQRRGCQLTFRVFLEYPSQDISIPQYLIDQGVKITEWKNDDNDKCFSPDYKNPKLRSAIEKLIIAMGEKYDGDPRVAFLTMGFLGHWGEWHSYPRDELFPDKKYQAEVISLFQKSFTKTQVMMRYPAGDGDFHYTKNSDLPFGFHDDSFAWATISTGKDEDDWFFQALLETAGPEAVNRWKTHVIGGEIRPEIWGCIFDTPGCEVEGQGFDDCVNATHVSWLMDSGMFQDAPSKARSDKAKASVVKMGYELFVSSADVSKSENSTSLKVNVTNRGVAPFYYDWPVELSVLDKAGKPVTSKTMNWKLSSVLPAGKVIWEATLDRKVGDNESIAIRVANPMTGGKPLRFANKTQNSDNQGWLILLPGDK